jgi:hypothetical protein
MNILIEKNHLVFMRHGVKLATHDATHPSHLILPIIERD